ncbi:MAG: hypothetical protein DRI44_02610 [Chlamydiae bacterium]|nr:MAG: hypothetical protein DRI44_02610 [Chlamydiota bacterium]
MDLCKYYDKETRICRAQGDSKTICLVPTIEKCQFRDNPKFDRLTLLEKRIEKIERVIEALGKWLNIDKE